MTPTRHFIQSPDIPRALADSRARRRNRNRKRSTLAVACGLILMCVAAVFDSLLPAAVAFVFVGYLTLKAWRCSL